MTTKWTKILCVTGIALGMMFMITACEKEGPAEKAGEKIDQAIEKTQETVEDKMTTQGPAEKAGEKIDETVDAAEEKAKEAKKNVKEAVNSY